jgi:hypothetical protein
LGRVHLVAGATPCNWPSYGKTLPLLPVLQPTREMIANEANKNLLLFFIVFTLRLLANVMNYYYYQQFSNVITNIFDFQKLATFKTSNPLLLLCDFLLNGVNQIFKPFN